jgi:hypothetical protein
MSRAFKHLQDLNAHVKEWLSGDHIRFRREHDPDALWDGPEPPGNPGPDTTTYYLAKPVFIPGMGPGTAPEGVVFGKGAVVTYASATEQPPTDPISLLIGDTLHNLRSGLDVLAYSLAAYTKPLPEDFAHSSEFPIFGDEDRHGTPGIGSTRFNQLKNNGDPVPGSGLFKIRGWHPDAQTIVEGLQPYHRGNTFRDDPLWILHDLENVNKHRLLHTTVAISTGVTLIPSKCINLRCIGPGFIRGRSVTIETETPIGWVYGVHPIDPSLDVNVEVGTAIDVALDAQAPAAAGLPVARVLTDIYTYVVGTVLPALTPYL